MQINTHSQAVAYLTFKYTESFQTEKLKCDYFDGGGDLVCSFEINYHLEFYLNCAYL